MSLGQWHTPNRSVNLTAPRPVDGFSGPAKRGIGGGHMDAGEERWRAEQASQRREEQRLAVDQEDRRPAAGFEGECAHGPRAAARNYHHYADDCMSRDSIL